MTAIGFIGPLAYVLLWMFAAQAPPAEKGAPVDARNGSRASP